MWKRLNYGGMILLTTPFVYAAVLVGLVEMLLDLDGKGALFIARPFLWARDRKME